MHVAGIVKSIRIVPLLMFLLGSCEEDKKTSVLRTKNTRGNQLHWYVYSRPTTYSQSYVEYISKESADPIQILNSHYLTNISFNSDTILIQCHNPDYELINRTIDTLYLLIQVVAIGIEQSLGLITHPLSSIKFYVPNKKEFWQ